MPISLAPVTRTHIKQAFEPDFLNPGNSKYNLNLTIGINLISTLFWKSEFNELHETISNEKECRVAHSLRSPSSLRELCVREDRCFHRRNWTFFRWKPCISAKEKYSLNTPFRHSPNHYFTLFCFPLSSKL